MPAGADCTSWIHNSSQFPLKVNRLYRWHAKRKKRIAAKIGNGEISLGYDVHSDDDIAIVGRVLKFEYFLISKKRGRIFHYPKVTMSWLRITNGRSSSAGIQNLMIKVPGFWVFVMVR